MATIENQLLKIPDRETRSIRGIKIYRESDYEFLIDDVIHDLEGACFYIDESGSSKRKGIDYNTIAFIIMKPSSHVVSTHRARDKKDHRRILDIAFKKQCFVYTSGVVQRDGKTYAPHPWIVDWDSVNALYDEKTGKPKVEFKDDPPRVKKKLTKKERARLAKLNDDDDDDVVDVMEKPAIFCPYCDHKINSTPGRTLHVKSKHSEKFEEYREWLKSLGKN